jgi:hypothetical protein
VLQAWCFLVIIDPIHSQCKSTNLCKNNSGTVFYLYSKTYYMKKLSIIVAMLVVIGVSISSCSAGAHIGTKHHGVSAGAQAH